MAPANKGAEWVGAVGLTNLVRRERFENQNGAVTELRSGDSRGRLPLHKASRYRESGWSLGGKRCPDSRLSWGALNES
jgi:hypothetical protein